MAEWVYRLPSDDCVSVRARKKPLLLAGFLGPETSGDGPPVLALDLMPGKEEDRPASLAVGPSGRSATVRGVYKAVPWSCRVSENAEGGWTAGFVSPLQREYLAMHVVLVPLLRRLLLDRGIAMVTGAAFQLADGAVLVAGPTGQGKTVLLLAAMERGAPLVGDEYLGLREDGTLAPVARLLALRAGTFAQAPRMLERLSRRRKAALGISKLVSRVTAGRVEPLVHVSPSELGLPAIPEPRALVRRFFWLQPGADPRSSAACETMTAGEAAGQLSIMQAAHDLWYGDLGVLFDALRRAPAGADHGSRWRETVERGLAGAGCYRLTFPAGEGVPEDVLQIVLAPGGQEAG